jgi:hypothetical protein
MEGHFVMAMLQMIALVYVLFTTLVLVFKSPAHDIHIA